ncbi:unnamed protein product [Blepharisma stoltei]|uniref:Transmembrane protein n=1 Tax=Blepharisma stoltei TaxID=1481888 RepID=A0AAU9IKZ0_9CILI|nr:unnamed protein product [Blepharisma stoltei]
MIIFFILSLVVAQITLQDGEIIEGHITNDEGGTNQYVFHTHRSHISDLTFTLTPLAGTNNSDLLLSTSKIPNNTSYDISTFGQSEKSIKIGKNQVMPNHDYFLSVICLSICNYSIYVSHGEDIRLITDMFYAGQVGLHKFKYYSYLIEHDHEDITITATALSGDPDIYMSLNPNYTQPSTTKYDFFKSDYGSDSIRLYWEHDIKQHCSSQPCTLYIGIYGYLSSTYTLKVHSNVLSPSLLHLNVPEMHQTKNWEYDYFYAITNSSSQATISLQTSDGNPNLYISIIDPSVYGYSYHYWTLPTPIVYLMLSDSTSQNEEIKIKPKDLKAYCSSDDCIVVALVHCFTGNCRYMIEANQDNIYWLLEGEPKHGAVEQNKYTYYKFYCNDKDANIVITLTTENGKNLDMFAIKGENKIPENNQYDWKSEYFEDNSLIIVRKNGASLKGVYIIGVYGNQAAKFVIMVAQQKKLVSKISANIPIYGRLDENSENYYAFYNYLDKDFTIQLLPLHGNVIYYASNDINNNENFPTESSHIWSSINSENGQEIVIKSNDQNYCSNCNFLISVASASNCSYILSVSNSDQILTKNRNKTTIFKQFWFWVLLALLTLTATFGLITYFLLKKTKKQLEYEIQDVRNVAGTGIYPQKSIKNDPDYDNLNEEEIDLSP